MNKLISALVFSVIAAISMNVFAAGTDTAKPAAAKSAETTKPAEAAKPAAGEKLDINTATEQQLRDFPGIGEARAQAIIKGRPYKAKDELVKKKIIPKAVYDKIKDGIIAKQAK